MENKTADIAIKNGIFVNSRETRKADIFIKDALIDSIESCGSPRRALKVIDASEKFVLPGIIDAHLHPVYADNIDTLSKAAVCGGITTLIPYIGAVKAWGKTGTILDAVKDFIEEGEKNSLIDFGIHCSLTRDDMEQIETMIPKVVEMGVTSAKTMKCPLYLPHVSAKESLEVIKLFKRWGEPDFFTETCPHYLTLTDEEMKKRGSLAKMAPPLRKKEDVEEIWRAVDEKLIDVIASDAAGHLVKNKEPLWDNIWRSPYGIPGLDTMFTVAYDEGINKRGITLSRLVELMSENPAKIFGLYPRKGILERGSDADIVIFDPEKSYTIEGKNQYLHVDYSMYEGRVNKGAPILVIQRGKILVEEGKLKADQAHGEFIPSNKFKQNL